MTGRYYAARSDSADDRRVWAGDLLVVARALAQLSGRALRRELNVAALAALAIALRLRIRQSACCDVHATWPPTAANSLPGRLDDHVTAADHLLPIPPSLVAFGLYHRPADVRAGRG